MKPGDKVWVFDDFDTPTIREAILVSIIKVKNKRTKFCFVFETNRDMEFCSYNVFPTREALCEHYRKIFE